MAGGRRVILRIAPLLVATIALLVPGAEARAAQLTIDTTADGTDASPGDGVCATLGGSCTLRAAIQEANALPGGDLITIPAGTYALMIAGADEDGAVSGDLDVTDDVTITGAGAEATVIDGVALDRVLEIRSGAVAVVSGITIRNGNATFSGGGIRNSGALTFSDGVIESNTVTSYGGGVFNSGSLTIEGSVIAGNSANISGGVSNVGVATISNSEVSENTAAVEAGGVGSDTMLTLDQTTVASNTADVAAGIGNRGEMIITGSTIDDNTATGDSGGIGNDAGAELIVTGTTISGNAAAMFGGIGNGGTITLVESTVRDNEAETVGGGIANGGDVTIERSTVSTNSATSGAGIVNGVNGSLTAINSTLSRNSATAAGAALNLGTLELTSVTVANNGADEEGSAFLNAGRLTLKNTLLAKNGPRPNCSGNGSIISEGYNLDDDGSCALGARGDLARVESLIDIALFDHGGSTETHGFFPGSWAIDGAGGCPPPATDQRGVARPQGSACDIGAFEVEGGSFRLGDANGDRRANSLDAALVLQVGAGLFARVPPPPGEDPMDANWDREVNALDAALILQADAGLLDGLPPAR